MSRRVVKSIASINFMRNARVSLRDVVVRVGTEAVLALKARAEHTAAARAVIEAGECHGFGAAERAADQRPLEPGKRLRLLVWGRGSEVVDRRGGCNHAVISAQ